MAVLVAQSQGHIGHLLQSELSAAIGGATVVTVVTHVEVDPADPAFATPTKPIGPMLSEADARDASAAHGWHVAPEGDGWRRMVASPEPVALVEIDTIRSLCDSGRIVIGVGGGGIPVEVTASEEQHLVNWLSKRLGAGVRAPDLEPAGFALVGGRLLPGSDGGPAAQFMYEDQSGRRLTLYLRHAQWDSGETAFRDAERVGVSLFYWIDGPFGYALAGDLDRERLLEVARLVYR